MCGIVGYIGNKEVAPLLVDCLRRLEYRGYDSAGVAVFQNGDHNEIVIRKAIGKLYNLDSLLKDNPAHGAVGMGHTRWATHGEPSEENAHPHRSGSIVVVHNGIIENNQELRDELVAKGHMFLSETDTEVIPHLIDQVMREDTGLSFKDALYVVVRRLDGAFAIVAMCEREPDKLLVAKKNAPIVIGLGDAENFVASDIPALLEHTRKIVFLEDGEIAEVTRESVTYSKFNGEPIEHEPQLISWDVSVAMKNGYKHFLLKEIHEQPRAIIDTMRGRVSQGTLSFRELEAQRVMLMGIKNLRLIACGTSWHACLIGKFLIEEIAGIPVEVDYASEYRYRKTPTRDEEAVLVISQSGETADTGFCLDLANQKCISTIAICNVFGSNIARKAKITLITQAGPELSVASSKAFTTQLTTLYLFAIHMGILRGVVNKEQERKLLEDLTHLPTLLQEVIADQKAIELIANSYRNAKGFLYLGRGVNYPVALEGALKLKELSYIQAEGYPAGEMKHGPIALIDEKMPVVICIPHDELYQKSLSNLQEVVARGAPVIALTDAPAKELARLAKLVKEIVLVPHTNHFLMPILFTIPMQLLAYHIAVLRGTDVDQPRNLAKSVTVE